MEIVIGSGSNLTLIYSIQSQYEDKVCAQNLNKATKISTSSALYFQPT